MIDYIFILIGLALLYQGANWFVEGASSLAKHLGISSLVIGLTVVAFGTSMPELVVNFFASIQGNSDVAFGNIVGSNIINLLLILGVTGLIAPLIVQKPTVWKEIPFALLAVLVLTTMSNKIMLANDSDNILTRADGIILLFFFSMFLYYIFETIRNSTNESSDNIKEHSSTKISFMLIAGFIFLVIGGKLTVDGAVSIARQMGISEFLISSTIVAAGTSLPELVTSVAAALKKEMDISVGNIVGSNIFNIFFIMGVSSIISPLTVPIGINVDLIILAIATLLFFIFMFIGKKHKFERWEALTFLAIYVGYTLFIINRG
ncbi:K+dependent Na+ exchanger related-protein [Methanomethylovorans hollandica DSM 15978]|uniref:K+dependent Na+ exchanger related-protein n=1 Tax=Methanomethylovorans hollandica (strain DSM 15978 / NBRC 107637 / DMS1) TaxID=867904 RepID=L0KYP4_METHD|nr:calcium/sodium antiporter [Methanomethylovorans hollandica]AGB49198.1 K+dependent Na+ exchanger related-protein [Methanomethylovorans hollandica DSM 15978]